MTIPILVFETDDVNHSSAFVVFDAVMSTTLAWIESFNPSTTKNLPFYVDNDTIKQVPTMYTEGKYNWGRVAKLNASFIELPLEVQSFLIKLDPKIVFKAIYCFTLH